MKLTPINVSFAKKNKRNENKDKQNIKKETKISKKAILSSLGMLAIFGIAAVSIKNKTKAVERLKNDLSQVVNSEQPINQQTYEELLAEVQRKLKSNSLTVEEFKKVGKFDKGKAILGNNPLDGTLWLQQKDGKVCLEYVRGAVHSATKYDSNQRELYIKKYLYSSTDQIAYIWGWKKTPYLKNNSKPVLQENFIAEILRDDNGEIIQTYLKKADKNGIMFHKQTSMLSDNTIIQDVQVGQYGGMPALLLKYENCDLDINNLTVEKLRELLNPHETYTAMLSIEEMLDEPIMKKTINPDGSIEQIEYFTKYLNDDSNEYMFAGKSFKIGKPELYKKTILINANGKTSRTFEEKID